MEIISFSELIAKISDSLSDKDSDELAEIAKHILDKEVSHQGDGTFVIS